MVRPNIGTIGKISVPYTRYRATVIRYLGSKVIAAINKDKKANIFSVTRFGVVADYKKVLPALTAKLKELKST